MSDARLASFDLLAGKLRAEKSRDRETLRVVDSGLAKNALDKSSRLRDATHAMGASRQRAKEALPGRWLSVLQKGDLARVERNIRAARDCDRKGEVLQLRSNAAREQLRLGERRIERLTTCVEERKRERASCRESRLASAEIETRSAFQMLGLQPAEGEGRGRSELSTKGVPETGRTVDRPENVESGEALGKQPVASPVAESLRPGDSQNTSAASFTSEVRPAPQGEIDSAKFSMKAGVAELNFVYRTGDGRDMQIAISQAGSHLLVNLHAPANADRYKLMSQRKEITQALRAAGIPVSHLTFRTVR